MHEIRRNPHKSKLTNCFYDLVKSFMKMFKQSDQLDCHMTVYERSLFLVSTLFYQHVTESGKFKPWVLLRVTQTHEFWVMHVLIFGPLSMSNHTHTLTWIAPWIEYMTFVSVVMSARSPVLFVQFGFLNFVNTKGLTKGERGNVKLFCIALLE